MTTFLDLTDTPNSYSGKQRNFVRINGTLDGLDFVKGHCYWATEFGALDPNNPTRDDAQKIQDAIDQAFADGGGTVYCPAGSYIIKSSIAMKSNVHLIGAGGFGASLNANHGSSHAALFVNAPNEIASNVVIKNFIISFVGCAPNYPWAYSLNQYDIAFSFDEGLEDFVIEDHACPIIS